MNDILCPYCGHWDTTCVEIGVDSKLVYGCRECGKSFVVRDKQNEHK